MSGLGDAELDELDDLLARTPEPYRPLGAVGLDGYLCGVLVQPRVVAREEWLPPVFDLDGAAFPASADRAWRARCEALIERHHDALRGALAEQGGFDPVLAEGDDAAQALAPWLEGFEHALACIPDLGALDDEAVADALGRLRAAPGLALGAAVEAVVDAVLDLEAATHERRWHVATVRHAGPKVGRNDACPCGSGRKFKHCHGAG